MSYEIKNGRDLNLKGKHIVSVSKWVPALNLIDLKFHKDKMIIEDISLDDNTHSYVMELVRKGKGKNKENNYWDVVITENNDWDTEYGPNHCGWLVVSMELIGYRPNSIGGVIKKSKSQMLCDRLVDFLWARLSLLLWWM